MVKRMSKVMGLSLTCALCATTPILADTRYDVPDNSSFKSYMSYKAITKKNSPQYNIQSNSVTDEYGFRKFNNCYCVAIGTGFHAPVGTYIDVTLSTGKKLHCIVSDLKDNKHTDSTNKQVAINGNVVEFIVDTRELHDGAKKLGDVSYVPGMEGYVDYIDVRNVSASPSVDFENVQKLVGSKLDNSADKSEEVSTENVAENTSNDAAKNTTEILAENAVENVTENASVNTTITVIAADGTVITDPLGLEAALDGMDDAAEEDSMLMAAEMDSEEETSLELPIEDELIAAASLIEETSAAGEDAQIEEGIDIEDTADAEETIGTEVAAQTEKTNNTDDTTNKKETLKSDEAVDNGSIDKFDDVETEETGDAETEALEESEEGNADKTVDTEEALEDSATVSTLEKYDDVEIESEADDDADEDAESETDEDAEAEEISSEYENKNDTSSKKSDEKANSLGNMTADDSVAESTRAIAEEEPIANSTDAAVVESEEKLEKTDVAASGMSQVKDDDYEIVDKKCHTMDDKPYYQLVYMLDGKKCNLICSEDVYNKYKIGDSISLSLIKK